MSSFFDIFNNSNKDEQKVTDEEHVDDEVVFFDEDDFSDEEDNDSYLSRLRSSTITPASRKMISGRLWIRMMHPYLT